MTPPTSGVLEREPAQDARRARSLLGVLERGVAQAARVEQPGEHRPLRPVAGDGERERREQLDVVLVDRRVDELPDLLERRACGRARAGAAAPHRAGRAAARSTRRRASRPSPTAAARPCATREAPAGELLRRLDGEILEPRPEPGRVDHRGSPCGRPGAARAGRAPSGRAPGRRSPRRSRVSTPTWPRSTRPKRPARPAIWAISHACRSRRSSPSNFCVSAKRSVSQGRLTPCPSTSVAQQTARLPAHEALDLEPARGQRHRAVEDGDLPGRRRFSSPASASTARRLKATTTVPGRRLWKETSPVQSSGALRSKKRTSACGKAFSDQRQRLDRAEQEDVPVLAREEQARPGRAALAVVRPLHLVEHEHLAGERRHLGRAADDRRVLVDALLPRDEADALGAELRGQPAVRLLGEHAQRRREDAPARSRRGTRAPSGSCPSSSGRRARRPSPARRRGTEG